MGLAASQARLLFITSRQNDVSAQMQRVSNQNMILARDEDEVSEKYNRMLSATKLETVDGAELSYENLMGAAGAAAGLTSAAVIMKGNKVALSPASIASYGLPESGNAGDITKIYPTAKDFVKKVTGSDEIANAVVETTTNTNTVTDTNALTENDKTRLAQFTSTYGEYPKTQKLVDIKDMLNAMGSISEQDITNAGGDQWLGRDIVKNSSSLTQIWQGSNNNTEIASDGDKKGVPGDQARRNVKAIGTAFMNKLLSYFGIKNSNSGIAAELQAYVDKMSKDAYDWNMGNGTERRNYQGKDNTISEIAKVWETSTHGSAENDHMAVNLTRMLRRMTDMVLQSLGAGDSNKIGVRGDSWQGTPSDMITITVNSKGIGEAEYKQKLGSFIGENKLEAALNYLSPKKSSENSTGNAQATNESQASYYKSIYDKLNQYGWITDTLVTDSSKLTEALKNGTYTINGASAKASGYFEEKTDSNATAKAEAYWNTEMKKIQRKEKQLDTQLTKLQTEYSSLTNDYNSVKSILDANVQRSFTYCSNG